MDTLTFTLEKPAAKTGGDKYTCTTIENFVIYIPQSISRKINNKPSQNLNINITTQ